MTKGLFNLCEYTPYEIKHGMTQEPEETRDMTHGVVSRGASRFLIVSPTHDTLNEDRGYKYRRPLSVKTELVNTMKFCAWQFPYIHNHC